MSDITWRDYPPGQIQPALSNSGQAMTQHTETATPKRYDWFTEDFGGDSVMRQAVDGRYVLHEDYAALQAKLTTARLELSAERDAVAQLIGERNELREKLGEESQRNVDMLVTLADHVMAQGRLLAERDTLRTQLAQAHRDERRLRQAQWQKDAILAEEMRKLWIRIQNVFRWQQFCIHCERPMTCIGFTPFTRTWECRNSHAAGTGRLR